MASGKVISIGCASLQLVKYHTYQVRPSHTWTNSLKSSPKMFAVVTRSHHRMIMYMALSVFGDNVDPSIMRLPASDNRKQFIVCS